MFGVDTTNLRSAIIKYIKAGTAIQNSMDRVIDPVTANDLRLLVFDLTEDDIKKLLTDHILKQIGENRQKVDEMVNASEIRALSNTEQLAYFAVLHARAQQVGSDAGLFSYQSGLRLADNELQLITEYCVGKNWDKVERIGLNLLRLATDLHHHPYVAFVAAYYLGLADYFRKNYERAKNNWESALTFYPGAKELILNSQKSDQVENIDYFYETVQIGLKDLNDMHA